MPTTSCFDHEKLDVYQRALEFAAWCEPCLQELPKSAEIRNQLDRASVSIVLNIAEGNGRFSPPDRCRFFDIARGSGLEAAACLDLIGAESLSQDAPLEEGKIILKEIVAMLIGLIRSNSPTRLHEAVARYDAEITRLGGDGDCDGDRPDLRGERRINSTLSDSDVEVEMLPNRVRQSRVR